jgi:uncharacterized membrane protein YeaQ/YmgE (transglycosylase-associated protein family)
VKPRIAFGMDNVGWLLAIVIGGLAGWIAERVMESRMGLIRNILLGIIGALVGGWIATRLQIDYAGFLGNLVVATLGAILVIFLYRVVRGQRRA